MNVVPMHADPQNDVATFGDFWTLWPKRVARMEAEKAWKRLDDVQHVEALVGLVAWRPVWLSEDRLRYVPNASTWLNQQRWTDELPETWSTARASHQAVKANDLPRKGAELPQHVRDAIAKLRR